MPATVNTPAATSTCTTTGTPTPTKSATCTRNHSKGRTTFRAKVHKRDTHTHAPTRTRTNTPQRTREDFVSSRTNSAGSGVSKRMAFGVLRRVRSEFAKRYRPPVPLTRSMSANAPASPSAPGSGPETVPASTDAHRTTKSTSKCATKDTAKGTEKGTGKITGKGTGRKVRMRSFARRHHDKASDLAELELDPARKAAAYMVAADAAMRYDLFESAERHLRSALRNLGHTDPDTLQGTEVTECLTLLGIVLDRAGKSALAEQALRDCIACAAVTAGERGVRSVQSQHAHVDPKSTITDIAFFVLASILERPPLPRSAERPTSVNSKSQVMSTTSNRSTEAAEIRNKLKAITIPTVHF